MWRNESKVIYRKINCREREPPSPSYQKVIQQWSAKSELLEVCPSAGQPCLKCTQVVKWGGILGGTVWFQDPQGHRKTRVPECNGFQASEQGSWLQSDPKSELSAQGCHKLGTTAVR